MFAFLLLMYVRLPEQIYEYIENKSHPISTRIDDS